MRSAESPPHEAADQPRDPAAHYDAYLRCTELLSLQKPAAARVHRDELLFQVVHQVTELWLKVAVDDASTADGLVVLGRLWEASRLLRRASRILAETTSALRPLEGITPGDYTLIRQALGNGSGLGSPGFRAVKRVSGSLRKTWDRLLATRHLDAVDIYRDWRGHPDLFDLAEALVDWDEQLLLWRAHHLRLIKRVIGGATSGTAGMPVSQLADVVDQEHFPALWRARDELTRQSGL